MITTTFKKQFQAFLKKTGQTRTEVSKEIRSKGGKTTVKTMRTWLDGTTQINEKTMDELEKHMARYGWKVEVVKK